MTGDAAPEPEAREPQAIAPQAVAPQGAVAVAEDGARPTRSAALALARLHLRTGALALARTELETLAGRDLLDDPGILDLAEVRWRTGDVAGAGEAVGALLDGDGASGSDEDPDSPLAWVIAAEAAAGRGRPTEARRYADRLRTASTASIDAIFAGLPRSSAWPPDPLSPVPTSATLFPTAGDGRSRDHGAGSPDAGRPRTGGPQRDQTDDQRTTTTGAATVGSPGLWDAVGEETAEAEDADAPPEIDPELAAVAEAIAATEALADVQAPSVPDRGYVVPGSAQQDGASEAEPVDDGLDIDSADALDAARLALVAGDPATAAVHLGLVLRLVPDLAPAVLDALADSDAAELAFVRGDAYRLLGREREARQAYRQVRRPAATPTPTPDSPTSSPPAPGAPWPSSVDPSSERAAPPEPPE